MIPLESIAQLSDLFDRYNNALDPLSAECLAAGRQFEEMTSRLHSAHAPDVEYPQFRYELVRQCREYLRKN
ncbi:MAG: hypothetical protein NTW03_14430 [Verrucomicrobia bacterium]|nr:hypothetical protein [Verrucomicrobiota bacterium]